MPKEVKIVRLSLGTKLRLLYPEAFEQAGELCQCGHPFLDHDGSMCWGVPVHPDLDAGGECPCNGFTRREPN